MAFICEDKPRRALGHRGSSWTMVKQGIENGRSAGGDGSSQMVDGLPSQALLFDRQGPPRSMGRRDRHRLFPAALDLLSLALMVGMGLLS